METPPMSNPMSTLICVFRHSRASLTPSDLWRARSKFAAGLWGTISLIAQHEVYTLVYGERVCEIERGEERE